MNDKPDPLAAPYNAVRNQMETILGIREEGITRIARLINKARERADEDKRNRASERDAY